MTDSDTDSKDSTKGSVPSNFIRNMITQDLAINKHEGRVCTRFPPEPNGYLHIGHAKSICLNFGVAEENGGVCNLRFDDTNPIKESQEYVDAIKNNIAWLGFKWHGDERYSSSYFDQLFDFAVELIQKSKAFVCGLSPEEARQYRGTLTTSGMNSPDRERTTEENLDLFARMREGDFPDGKYTLRAKIDMTSPNINMRDPILYRIRHIAHHQTGNEWCIYPTYDYTHCISDAIEGITHSLCTLEFEDHRPLYNWILNTLNIDRVRLASDLAETEYKYVLPEQTEFAKLKLNYTMMGKRNLKDMVEGGIVAGWDDPRMPTLAGMRRRGFTPASIRNFCEMIGVSRSESVVDMGMLEHAIRENLDKNAPRAMCTLDPLRVVLTNLKEGEVEYLDIANHPKNEGMGRRSVPFTKEIFIERSDFEEQPKAGFKRLIPGGEVRLRGSYVVRCDGVVKDDSGKLQHLNCSIDKATLGKKPEGRKVRGVIHWVSAEYGVPVRVRLYDRLFNIENPESKETENYQMHLNPDSLVKLDGCIAEPAVMAKGAYSNFQFERLGYFCIDLIDSSAELSVFNRTITLRDSWSDQ